MNNEILSKLGARSLKKSEIPDIDSKLEEIESFFNIKFSETHKSILKKFGNAIVFDEGAKYKPKVNSPLDDSEGFQNIEVLYGISDNDNGLINKNKMYSEQLPPSIITIGEAPGGNQVCINKDNGKVLFWHHEADNEENMLFEIAPSFDEFISQLKPDNESQSINSSAIEESESWLDI